jgi:hypothetical protein
MAKKKSKVNLYLASFDCLGFECVMDLTDYDKKAMWASLQNKQIKNEIPLHAMIMRAKTNPQRSPEIWTFQSEIDLVTLLRYTRDMPQEMADLIRENGTSVFVTPKQKEVIR